MFFSTFLMSSFSWFAIPIIKMKHGISSYQHRAAKEAVKSKKKILEQGGNKGEEEGRRRTTTSRGRRQKVKNCKKGNLEAGYR